MIREIICFYLLRPMKRGRKSHFDGHWLSVADFTHVNRYTLPSKRDIIDIETCKSVIVPRQGSYLPARTSLFRHSLLSAIASHPKDCYVGSLRAPRGTGQCIITILMTLRESCITRRKGLYLRELLGFVHCMTI